MVAPAVQVRCAARADPQPAGPKMTDQTFWQPVVAKLAKIVCTLIDSHFFPTVLLAASRVRTMIMIISPPRSLLITVIQWFNIHNRKKINYRLILN